MDEKTLLTRIAELEAQNAALAKKAAKGNRIKVSTKGAVSVYGLGQWPVTLYQSQWETLLAMKPDIEKFIVDNKASLKTKEDKPPKTPETK